jgi:hypothetical protein
MQPQYVDKVLYVLHFDHPNGTVSHYSGTTHESRFMLRLREHTEGIGGRYTKKMRTIGATMRLGGYKLHSSQHEEMKPVLLDGALDQRRYRGELGVAEIDRRHGRPSHVAIS